VSPPKRQLNFTELLAVISQKREFLLATHLGTSSPTIYGYVCGATTSGSLFTANKPANKYIFPAFFIFSFYVV
jgi:hypothetical protein